METNLQIKNVVCQRYMMSVKEILNRLDIPFKKVSLSEVVPNKPLKENEFKKLQKEFRKVGFAILVNKEEKIMNKIKSVILKLFPSLSSNLPFLNLPRFSARRKFSEENWVGCGMVTGVGLVLLFEIFLSFNNINSWMSF